MVDPTYSYGEPQFSAEDRRHTFNNKEADEVFRLLKEVGDAAKSSAKKTLLEKGVLKSTQTETNGFLEALEGASNGEAVRFAEHLTAIDWEALAQLNQRRERLSLSPLCLEADYWGSNRTGYTLSLVGAPNPKSGFLGMTFTVDRRPAPEAIKKAEAQVVLAEKNPLLLYAEGVDKFKLGDFVTVFQSDGERMTPTKEEKVSSSGHRPSGNRWAWVEVPADAVVVRVEEDAYDEAKRDYGLVITVAHHDRHTMTAEQHRAVGEIFAAYGKSYEGAKTTAPLASDKPDTDSPFAVLKQLIK